MNPKTARNLTLAICIIAPILPAYIVMLIIWPLLSIIGKIVVSIIEYFGFQYIIALFIKRMAERRLRTQQKKIKAIP